MLLALMTELLVGLAANGAALNFLRILCFLLGALFLHLDHGLGTGLPLLRFRALRVSIMVLHVLGLLGHAIIVVVLVIIIY